MGAEASTKTRVLFVDDSRLMQKAALKMLANEFDVVIAEDGVEALDLLAKDTTVQVVFSDLTMPRCDGYELLRTIRTGPETGLQNIPVIIVTGADNDEAARQKALDMGATDFITKPFTSVDVLARARAHANYQRITRQLQAQTTLDALTGLSNKAGFLDRLQQDIAYAKRQQHELTLVKLEIDDLREIFLKQGKQNAEALVVHMANVLRGHIRNEDTAARIGLGGFMLSLPGGKPDGVAGMVARLQAEVLASPPVVNDQAVAITTSATVYGVAVDFEVSSAECFQNCEAQFLLAEKRVQPAKSEIPPEPPARQTAPETSEAEKIPGENIPAQEPGPAVVAPVSVEEPVQIDPVLEAVGKGDTQDALRLMPKIIKRLVPLLKLLSASQRTQLIQFLQKL